MGRCTDEIDARNRFAAALGGREIAEISRRESRWLSLGPDLVAFAADDDAGWARLQLESALLARWRAAGVPAPRVLADDTLHGVQLRERLHGITGEAGEPLLFGGPPPDAARRLAPDCPLSPFGARLAESYGALAARIHSAISLSDALALGLSPAPPPDLAALRTLVAAACSPATLAALDAALPWLATQPAADTAIHGDLHFHNLCLAADGTITGVFDLDAACLAPASTDLHYAHSLGPRFVSLALPSYAATRTPLDEAAVRRAHVLTALDHLRWHPPGTPRHPSIVAWVTATLTELVG